MNVFDGLINRFNKAKERISELEYRSAELPKLQSKQKNEMKKNNNKDQSIQGLWDNSKKCNLCIIRIPERDERRSEQKNLLK